MKLKFELIFYEILYEKKIFKIPFWFHYNMMMMLLLIQDNKKTINNLFGLISIPDNPN